jgi:hypothetical protein
MDFALQFLLSFLRNILTSIFLRSWQAGKNLKRTKRKQAD